MMEISEMDYNDLMTKALLLLDDENKVRRFLMETTRIFQVLGHSEVLYDYEQHTLRRNYWRFIFCCNLTPMMNRRTAAKIYARFVGGYCEGLRTATADTLGVLVDELARSIAQGEAKEEQLEILRDAVAYMYKE